MAGVPVHHLQLTQAGKTPFAQDLMDLLALVHRPAAEFRAFQITNGEDTELRLIVRCELRGSEVTPRSDPISFTVYARTWEEGLGRACQEAIARLVRFHQYELGTTRFRHYGMRDGEGDPTPGVLHPVLRDHLFALETHLALTQAQLDEVRVKHDYNLQTEGPAPVAPIELETRDKIIKELQDKVASLEESNKMLKKKTRSLKRKCDDLEEEIDALDDGEDIQKGENAHISDDEDWMDEEYEEVPDTDDEDFIDDREEDEL
jgi:hypothetical protein